jgi:hypothetical protein
MGVSGDFRMQKEAWAGAAWGSRTSAGKPHFCWAVALLLGSRTSAGKWYFCWEAALLLS